MPPGGGWFTDAAAAPEGQMEPGTTLSHDPRVPRDAGITRTHQVATDGFVGLRRDDLGACFPGLLGSMLAAANRGDVGRQLELMSPAPDAPRTIYPCPDAPAASMCGSPLRPISENAFPRRPLLWT